jgi:hypothetical protein
VSRRQLDLIWTLQLVILAVFVALMVTAVHVGAPAPAHPHPSLGL